MREIGSEGGRTSLSSEIAGSPLKQLHGQWAPRDCVIYALGIGAGQESPLEDLEFTTTDTRSHPQVVYPTFGVIPGARVGVSHLLELLGDVAVDPTRMLHGEQTYEQLVPLPPEASHVTSGRVVAIWDKGTSTVVETEAEIAEAETGQIYGRSRQSLFFRGVGGWGGDRGPSAAGRGEEDPGPPDRVLTVGTHPEQALLYRLSGDSNPLHADPAVARAAGFERPILHGLCAYGVVGRLLLTSYADGDPRRFGSLSVRFSKPVLPGDTLTVTTWRRNQEVAFAVVADGGHAVMTHGLFTLRD